MPRKAASTVEKAVSDLTQGNETIPRLKLSETGYNGLAVINGNIFEECKRELRWPQSILTYKEMSADATIAPALNLMEMSIARVPWVVKIPEGFEDGLKDKADFLRQNMNDMEHSWGSFIRQVVSFNRYGFSLHEKVYRKRFKVNGSKYDDGLVGIKKLPIRSQDSISGWLWADDGRELSGVVQYKNIPTGRNQVTQFTGTQEVEIPRKKFLLFRNSPLKDNPEGHSPLSDCWLAWKFKSELERHEAMAISQDMRGLKVLYIPPRYMAEDASPEDKEIYAYYQRIMRNLHVNEQSGLILPQVLDDQGEQYFKFDVISVTGQKSHDVHEVIERYRQEIITSLMASQLILGQGGGGSFSLAESLSSITNMAIESKLQEIKEVLNHDLIPQLFALNGWDTAVTPFFDFGEVAKADLDVLSKYIQRTASLGLIKQDARTVNWIAEQAGMPLPFADPELGADEIRDDLTASTSRSGDGMETAGNGTSASPAGSDDASVANQENT